MIAAEFSKQLQRWRSRFLLIASIVVGALIAVGLGATAGSSVQPLGASGLALLFNQSGLAVGIASLLFTSGLFIPIVFAVSFGEPLASEAKWGSLRYLLVRPVSRSRVLSAKLLVGTVLALGTTFVIPVVATLIGTVYFGWHPLSTLGGAVSSSTLPLFTVRHLAPVAVLWRLLLATAYVAFGSGALVGVAVLVSVLTENVLAAVAGGLGCYIVSNILEALSSLRSIRPALPTEYYNKWTQLFVPGASLHGMEEGLIVQVVWLAATIGPAYWVFARKDILA